MMQDTASLRECDPGESARADRLREVQRRVALGVPVAKACRDLEYPRSSYYKELQKEEAPALQGEGSTQPEAETVATVTCDCITTAASANGAKSDK